jgi:hypothetical protein
MRRKSLDFDDLATAPGEAVENPVDRLWKTGPSDLG